jgi:hypothetical protein
MRSLATNFSRRGPLSCLIDSFKSAISLSIGIMTLNTVLSPSMRHQKVYVDILGGSEKEVWWWRERKVEEWSGSLKLVSVSSHSATQRVWQPGPAGPPGAAYTGLGHNNRITY